MNYKNYILNLRKSNNLTQVKLANLLNVSETTIKSIESERVKKPNTKLLESIAKYTKNTPISVARDIFFGESIAKVASHNQNIDLITKYGAYCMLNRWNLYKCELSRNKTNIDLKLINQKHSSNIAVLYSLKSFKLKNQYDFNELIELIYSGPILQYSKLNTKAKVKTIIIVFDYSNKQECKLYNSINKHCVLSLDGFKLSFVLFDRNKCKIII